MDLLERAEQFLAPHLLQKITARPRCQRVENMVGILIHRDHHELGSRQTRLERAHAFNAVHAGQIDVKEDYRGLFLRQFEDRRLGVAIFSGQLKPLGMTYPLGEDFPRRHVIFNQGHRDFHRRIQSGSTITTAAQKSCPYY